MKLITIDFETYYDKDFSLSKMTTEEYIRDERFEVIGVGVKVDDEEARWFSGNREQIQWFLGQYDWHNAIAVAHNALFDAAIQFSQRFFGAGEKATAPAATVD
jgi:hypothetical protein